YCDYSTASSSIAAFCQVGALIPKVFSGALTAQERGLAVYHGTLLEANYESGSFHYVRLRHVLEHIPNPMETLAEIHRITVAGATIEITVPNSDGLNARLFGRYWHQLDAPRHLFHYSPAVLTNLLSQFKFEKQSISFEKSYMGTSLRYWLRDNSPMWATGRRWQLIHLGLKIIRPFTSLLTGFGFGDEMTVIMVRC
ncbi:MAG: class I SAM-dependent methyltransferase, partial [Magnetococcales bacterium]|nr:class I SAM-dependent methyltransferase [Magnetococcales bacterium]